MTRRTLLAIFAGAVALATALTACSSSSSKSGSSPSKGASSSAAAIDTAANASKTLNVVVATLPQYLGNPFQAVNPPRAEVTSAIFDALTRISTSGTVEPWLASSWKRIDDATWQFALRKDVTFSNGEPFNADSVVATVAALESKDGTGSFQLVDMPTIKTASKIDDFTVNITTSTPNGVLPNQVTALDVIPPKYYAQVGLDGFTKAPIGTGPYKADSLSTTEWDLSANTTSWRKPKIQKLVIKQLLDLSARTNALRSHQADIDMEGDLDQLTTLKSQGFTDFPLANQGVLVLQFINTSGKPSSLDNTNVRLALNYAVDRESVDKSIFQGLAGAANQGVALGTTGYQAALPKYTYDPTKAKQLLSQAGYANGLSLTAVVSVGQFLGDTAIFQSVKSDLATVGVTLTVNQDTTANLTSDLLKGSWPADMFSTAYLAAPIQDATKGYFTNSCLKKPGAWCDQTQANLILKATSQTVGTPERDETLKELGTAVHDNPGGLFLFNVLKLAYTAKNIGGFARDVSSNTVWESITFQ